MVRYNPQNSLCKICICISVQIIWYLSHSYSCNLANSATVGKPEASTRVGSLCLSPHLHRWTDKWWSVVLSNRMRPMAKKMVNRKWDEAHIVQYTHPASRLKLRGGWLFISFPDEAGMVSWNITYGFTNFKYSTAPDIQEFHDKDVLKLHVLKTKIVSYTLMIHQSYKNKNP